MTDLTTAVAEIRQALDTAPMYERRNGRAALILILDALEEREAQLAQARELLKLALPCVEQRSKLRGGHADRIDAFLAQGEKP